MTRRGVALVLALWIIVVAGVAVSAAVARARDAVALAATVRARLLATAASESGIAFAADEIERRLHADDDTASRARWLNDLGRVLSQPTLLMGGARAQIVVIDPATRLDINAATTAQLTTLFSFITDAATAATAARAIRGTIERGGAAGTTRRLRSLDELADLPGIPADVLRAAAPLLTVDGDGHVNRRTAPLPVRRAAGGELVDTPTRLLIVSRGWQDGHPLTHEIQAVYALVREPTGDRLLLQSWRERDR